MDRWGLPKGSAIVSAFSVAGAFVMARRSGTSARFIAVYEPYRDTPKVKEVRETLPGTIEVVLSGATDEIHAMPKKFAYYRVTSK